MTPSLSTINPATITVHPKNPRHQLGDLTELTDSIKSLGVLEPLIGVKGDDDQVLLIAGHRRLEAAKAAGLDVVPVLIRSDLDTEAKQIEAMLVENVQRTDLTPIEEGEAYKQLLAFPGYTQAKIAKTTGRSKAAIKTRIALTALPEKAARKVESGQATLADAEALAAWVGKPQFDEIAKHLGTSNFSWAVQNAKRDAERRTAIADRTKKIKAGGGEITAQPDNVYGSGAEEVRFMRGRDHRLLFEDDFDHAKSCKHNAWYLGRDDMPTAWCLNPSVHDANTDDQDNDSEATGDAEERAQRAAEREAAQARREALEAARDARKAWIHENLLSEKVKPNKATMTGLLRMLVLTDTFADWLYDVDHERLPAKLRPADPDDGEIAALVAEHINTLTLEQLVQLTFVVFGEIPGLTYPSSWRGRDRLIFDQLVNLGYLPSTVEAEAHAEAVAAEEAAKAAEAAEAEDNDNETTDA